MILSVAIYDVRRYKRDLIMAVIFFIPCLLWVFRTSILGSVVALMVFSFIKYKLKALPVAFILLALFFSIVFLNPAVKNKMFRKDMDIEKVISSNGTSFDKDAIDSNGRFAMWAMSLKQFYDGKELTGSGSGTLQAAFYKMREKQGKAGIVHNDYVQILCDTGLIGLFLYLSIFVAMGIHATKEYGKRTNSDAIKVCAITAAAAGIGMAATAFTDNTVNYSMATLSYPFGMYGMMLGLIRAQNNKPQEIISEDEDLS
jgi:O-antigen ligase